jgi:hypothetical protein
MARGDDVCHLIFGTLDLPGIHSRHRMTDRLAFFELLHSHEN